MKISEERLIQVVKEEIKYTLKESGWYQAELQPKPGQSRLSYKLSLPLDNINKIVKAISSEMEKGGPFPTLQIANAAREHYVSELNKALGIIRSLDEQLWDL
jgi:hypothetical protein|tara:strand:- start:469 stop:774 length:306 start_codon:yes stop_codon:yes gene_type:complete